MNDTSIIYNLIFVPTIFLTFIPVKVLPVLPVAPINVFYYLFFFVFIANLKNISKELDIEIIKVLTFYLLYCFLAISLDIYKEALPSVGLWAGIRNIALTIMFITFVSNENLFKRTYKFICFLIIANIVFGLLINIFGEPFQSFRDSIIGIKKASLLGEGSRISGFSASIFGFSYVIVPTILLGFTLFLEKKTLLRLLVIIIGVLGIIFNAERSAFLVVSISFVTLLFKSNEFKFSKIVIVSVILIFSLVITTFITGERKTESELGTYEKLLTDRFGESSEGEFDRRIKQQIAGVLTILKNPLTGGNEREYEEILISLLQYGQNQKIKTYHVRKYRGHLAASHNHYINIGQEGGIIGIGIIIMFFITLRRCLTKFKNYAEYYGNMKYYYFGTVYSLYALLGNGLFHNGGVAFAEKTTWIFIGLGCAGYNISKKLKDDYK